MAEKKRKAFCTKRGKETEYSFTKKGRKHMKDVYDFTLVYSSAVRDLCVHPSAEGIECLTKTYVDYINAMDLRTVDCALRDFFEWLYPEMSHSIPLYSDGTDSYKKYRDVLKPLIQSMIRFHTDSPSQYKSHIDELGAISGMVGEVDAEHDLIYPYSFQYKETLDDVPTVDNGRLSELIVMGTRYACGRHTYMPGAVSKFITSNLSEITDEGLDEIAKTIKSVPQDYSFMSEACDDYMRKCLDSVNHEIERRKREKKRSV